MNRSSRVHLTLSILAIAAGGCVVTGDAGSLTTAATDVAPSTSGSSSSSTSLGETSTSDGQKLDLAMPDVEVVECQSVMETTTIGEAPSDIVIVVTDGLVGTTLESILQNFSLLIGNDQIEDVHVVMLAGYPPDGACIDAPPLGVEQCPTNDDNPPIYRHFAEVVEPDTALQQLLDAYPQWSVALRPEARKHVLVLSSGDAALDVEAFDSAFVALDPTLAGYVFHAMAPGADVEGDCSFVEPGEPWSPATGYLALAEATDGVFENACNFNLKVLFEELLDRIAEVALSCEYDIPPPPEGLVFEKDKVNVDYDDGVALQTVGWVETAAECASVDTGWYYDDIDDPQRILMCPQTCALFQTLQEASIEIRFGCTTIPAG